MRSVFEVWDSQQLWSCFLCKTWWACRRWDLCSVLSLSHVMYPSLIRRGENSTLNNNRLHFFGCQTECVRATWPSKLISSFRLEDFALQDWHWALDDIDDDCSSIHFWWLHMVTVCAVLCSAVVSVAVEQCFHKASVQKSTVPVCCDFFKRAGKTQIQIWILKLSFWRPSAAWSLLAFKKLMLFLGGSSPQIMED